MNLLPGINSEYRYERKYVTAELSPHFVESIVKIHPAGFSEIFYRRYVNNIYLDTFGLKNYFDRVDGVPDSVKTRIRWYGEPFGEIPNPRLEFKIKKGPLVKKEIFELGKLRLDGNFSLCTFMELLRISGIRDEVRAYLGGLEFNIMNRFGRKYFLSADRKFRLTIDSEISCYQINNSNNMFLNEVTERDMTVIEIKYDRDDDDLAREITGSIPLRMSRNSKYINAVERLNLWQQS